ncbi:Vacuolar protein sorting-associated protein 62 [Pseudocyphellaria aurata]|nr:Vacuolar protein sorting-associated protein 62 [Pseudocyphellaria aurata]
MSKLKQALFVLSLILLIQVNALGRCRSYGLPQLLLEDGNSKTKGSSSWSWVERRACDWFGACEFVDGRWRWLIKSAEKPSDFQGDPRDKDEERRNGPNDRENDSRVNHEIPQYVLDHAPLVHLFSGEKFWPCDIAEHLRHVTPHLNYTPIQARSQALNLTNLDDLNEWNNGRFVYLKSDDNVEERPGWLGGKKNIPNPPDKERESKDSDGLFWQHRGSEAKAGPFHDAKMAQKYLGEKRKRHVTNRPESDSNPPRDHEQEVREEARQRQQGGRSDAPAVLIVVNKGNGIVDAFWFFFYSYNLGNLVFNIRFGNHVGDWEHTLVRFENGKPRYVFYSEHFFGEAYSYGAVEKIGNRPVTYSATGTHAMYATPGIHPYILPLGLLHDETDRGPLWDPLLNSYAYTYDYRTDDLRASNLTPQAPTDWFYFRGHWGDKFYPSDDSRQYHFAGQYHYVSGPLGPRFKNLGRRKVCQGGYKDPCVIKNWLLPSTVKYWEGMGDGETERDSET